MGVSRILLCSTDDAKTKATWTALGFGFTRAEQLQQWGVQHHDLLHMDNTVQVGQAGCGAVCVCVCGGWGGGGGDGVWTWAGRRVVGE